MMSSIHEENDNKTKKAAVIFIALFIAILFFGIWRNFRTGVYYGDTFLHRKNADYYQANDNKIEVDRKNDITTFDISLQGEKTSATLSWNGKNAVIKFDDGVIVAGIWNDSGQLVNAEGSPVSYDYDDGIVVTVNGENPPIQKGTLSEVLCRIDLDLAESRGHVSLIILGAIFYIVGMLSFLFPETMAFLFTRWQYDQVELSDMGIFAEKVGGVVAMAAGMVLILHLIPL